MFEPRFEELKLLLLESHFFRLRAILFGMVSTAELAGNRRKFSLVTINGEAGHDLGVEVVEEVGEAAKETHSILKVPLASISGKGVPEYF
jgi:hypothetical protein